MRDDTKGLAERGDGEGARWVERYRASGLSLRDFAERHGLNAGRLHYWVYEKHAAPAARRSAGTVFAEVKLGELASGPSWGAEVSLAGGGTLRVSASAAPAWVVEVVRGLQGVC